MLKVFLSQYTLPTRKAMVRDVLLSASIGCAADSSCQCFIEGLMPSEFDKKRVIAVSSFTGAHIYKVPYSALFSVQCLTVDCLQDCI